MLLLSVLSILYLTCLVRGDEQPSFSFGPPFENGNINNWKTFGTAVVQPEGVRLTENRQSEQGAIWCYSPTNFEDWEVSVSFFAGSSNFLGADGLGIWYTKERGFLGPVFGNKDKFTGFGIIMDSFDNDGRRDNPSIYLAVNDGISTFEQATDGKSTDAGLRCSANFRARSEGPEASSISTVIIRYQQGLLSVSWHPPLSNSQTLEGATKCFETHVEVPMGYYFGISAATGGITDHHVVTSWKTKSLSEVQDLAKAPVVQRFGTRDRNQGVPLLPVVPPVDYSNILSSEMGENRQMASELASLTKTQYMFALEIDKSFDSLEEKIGTWNGQTNNRIQSVKNAVHAISASANHRDNVVRGLEQEITKLRQGVSELVTAMSQLKGLQESAARVVMQDRKVTESTHSQIADNLSSGNSLYNWLFWLIVLEFVAALAFSLWRRREKSRKYV